LGQALLTTKLKVFWLQMDAATFDFVLLWAISGGGPFSLVFDRFVGRCYGLRAPLHQDWLWEVSTLYLRRKGAGDLGNEIRKTITDAQQLRLETALSVANQAPRRSRL
jgi:hypothetical protein